MEDPGVIGHSRNPFPARQHIGGYLPGKGGIRIYWQDEMEIPDLPSIVHKRISSHLAPRRGSPEEKYKRKGTVRSVVSCWNVPGNPEH